MNAAGLSTTNSTERAGVSLPVIPGEDSDPGSDTVEFHRALSELIRVYQFRDRDRICCYDISVTQCYALELLALRGHLTVNDLAAGLYLDKSTTSRVIDALERKGYVARQPHPEDRRALLVEATREGMELYARIEQEILAEEQRLLADFDPDVRRAMTQLIGRLARAAAARVDTTGGSCCAID
jgi:MarR family 2-MHQ and catechol resistance regulon transcriptional repressor